MSRPNKIWFRKDIGWWMITLGGKKLRLAHGRENKKAAEQKFHELAAVRPQVPTATARVADIIEGFLRWGKTHLAPDTLRNYEWYGQSFSERWGYLSAVDLQPHHVTTWVDEHGWKSTTEYNARRSIFRPFSWAAEERLLAANPLRGLKRPKPMPRNRGLKREEYLAMLRASDRDFKVLLFSLWETGCRPKEARSLKWEQVHADRWILTEHKTAKKTRKPRIIWLTRPIQKLMAVLRRTSRSEYVFVNGEGVAWTANALRLRVWRLKQKLKLAPDVCAYLVRHAFGTQAILNGVDPMTVAELMGHASLEMVSSVYVHLAEQKSHLQAAVEKATRPHAASKPAPAFPRLTA